MNVKKVFFVSLTAEQQHALDIISEKTLQSHQKLLDSFIARGLAEYLDIIPELSAIYERSKP